jgi:hypothetical protein
MCGCMRLTSTRWPQIGQGSVPLVSAIGCSSGGLVLDCRLPRDLDPSRLPFGPPRCRECFPPFPGLKRVFVRLACIESVEEAWNRWLHASLKSRV